MSPELIFTPSDFVAVFNQTLETAYPSVVIEGELSSFRIAKNRWVYFDLKDQDSSVSFFGSIYQLPGPLEDGLLVRVQGVPRLHQRFGFTINFSSISPVGEGSLKKAELLLMRKLTAEGLFAPERKRPLPAMPERVGLVTATGSAASADFIKILNQRWGGVEVLMASSSVQGGQAPIQLVAAVELLNRSSSLPEVIIITRGGGSAEDLSAFNDERVVRAIAASRVPTLVAIGHETDESLAELAADARAPTPSAAAALLVPDKVHELVFLQNQKANLSREVQGVYAAAADQLKQLKAGLKTQLTNLFKQAAEDLVAQRRLLATLDPKAALRRGYALVQKNGRYVKSAEGIKKGDHLDLRLSDATIRSMVEQVTKNA